MRKIPVYLTLFASLTILSLWLTGAYCETENYSVKTQNAKATASKNQSKTDYNEQLSTTSDSNSATKKRTRSYKASTGVTTEYTTISAHTSSSGSQGGTRIRSTGPQQNKHCNQANYKSSGVAYGSSTQFTSR